MTWPDVVLILGLVYAFLALVALGLWSARNKSLHDLATADLMTRGRSSRDPS